MERELRCHMEYASEDNDYFNFVASKLLASSWSIHVRGNMLVGPCCNAQTMHPYYCSVCCVVGL